MAHAEFAIGQNQVPLVSGSGSLTLHIVHIGHHRGPVRGEMLIVEGSPKRELIFCTLRVLQRVGKSRIERAIGPKECFLAGDNADCNTHDTFDGAVSGTLSI